MDTYLVWVELHTYCTGLVVCSYTSVTNPKPPMFYSGTAVSSVPHIIRLGKHYYRGLRSPLCYGCGVVCSWILAPATAVPHAPPGTYLHAPPCSRRTTAALALHHALVTTTTALPVTAVPYHLTAYLHLQPWYYLPHCHTRGCAGRLLATFTACRDCCRHDITHLPPGTLPLVPTPLLPPPT